MKNEKSPLSYRLGKAIRSTAKKYAGIYDYYESERDLVRRILKDIRKARIDELENVLELVAGLNLPKEVMEDFWGRIKEIKKLPKDHDGSGWSDQFAQE